MLAELPLKGPNGGIALAWPAVRAACCMLRWCTLPCAHRQHLNGLAEEQLCLLQDLVIPAFVGLDKAGATPLLGFPPKQRSMLAFFRGDMGEKRLPNYSRGLRQKLARLAAEWDWAGQHSIHIGSRETPSNMTYSQLLSSSVFCPVLPGVLCS